MASDLMNRPNSIFSNHFTSALRAGSIGRLDWNIVLNLHKVSRANSRKSRTNVVKWLLRCWFNLITLEELSFEIAMKGRPLLKNLLHNCLQRVLQCLMIFNFFISVNYWNSWSSLRFALLSNSKKKNKKKNEVVHTNQQNFISSSQAEIGKMTDTSLTVDLSLLCFHPREYRVMFAYHHICYIRLKAAVDTRILEGSGTLLRMKSFEATPIFDQNHAYFWSFWKKPYALPVNRSVFDLNSSFLSSLARKGDSIKHIISTS